VVLGCSARSAPPAAHIATTRGEKIFAPHLLNAYRLHPRVISGGRPEYDRSFDELAAEGIKTIISVDVRPPDVDAAAQHALRYVHIPFGHDGLPGDLVTQLAKAIRDLPGPVYVHSRTGQHRAPAASAAACLMLGLLEPDDVPDMLKAAADGEDDPALVAAALKFRPIDPHELDQLQVEFRSTVEPSPMGRVMLAIEQAFDQLRLVHAAEWKSPAEHPDFEPSHSAEALGKQFAALVELAQREGRPDGFRDLAQDAQWGASDVATLLRPGPPDNEQAIASLNSAYQRMLKNCVECHRDFRDQ
jgi:protein tyrosine phosphatase (PTP) superfamily phosphohydrolase (DUF442 family)